MLLYFNDTHVTSTTCIFVVFSAFRDQESNWNIGMFSQLYRQFSIYGRQATFGRLPFVREESNL